MNYPLVSVIIPMYNMSKYVSETLNSVLLSDYQHIEIVVVDDGSTDNSVEICEDYIKKSDKIKLFTQSNKGVAAARNYAIKLSKGEYILPVDADDLISSNYITEAVKILIENSNIKVVACEVERFGQKTGIVNFPKFSYRLLARKNFISCCSMFRKSDWEKCGGFCEQEIFREDWDFWISLFKTGGDFFRLPFVGLKYRVTPNSRRLNVRKRKKRIIEAINNRHEAFLHRQLGGKLHYDRTLSRFFNFFCRIVKSKKIVVAPEFIEMEEAVYNISKIFAEQGEFLHNKTKLISIQNQNVAVSLFDDYGFLRKIVCGFFCKSKAHRLYMQALKQQKTNPNAPKAVGYYEERRCGLLTKSFFLVQHRV